MSSITEMLGSKVMDRTGELVSANMLTDTGKVVGLYFSSSWCPDIAFTPFLANFFSHFRTTDRGQHFEIVYVSADKDKDAFEQYFGEMPWHAIPYDDLQTRVRTVIKFDPLHQRMAEDDDEIMHSQPQLYCMTGHYKTFLTLTLLVS